MTSVTAIADKLGVEFALIHRQGPTRAQNSSERVEVLVGDVRDKVKAICYITMTSLELKKHILAMFPKVAILVDDMIDSGKTLAMAAQSLKENGAKTVFALVSHGSSSIIRILAPSNSLIQFCKSQGSFRKQK